MKKQLKFRQKNVIVWFIYNVLRLIPCLIFGPVFFIYYLFHTLFNIKEYKPLKLEWDTACKDYDSLVLFFRLKYRYKGDMLRGFCDHDSSIFEWLFGFGDCDDQALYSKKALKKLGYEAYRIGMFGFHKKGVSAHFDTLFVNRNKDGDVIEAKLFNYGHVISEDSIEKAIEKLDMWFNGQFPKNKTYVAVCLY